MKATEKNLFNEAATSVKPEVTKEVSSTEETNSDRKSGESVIKNKEQNRRKARESIKRTGGYEGL